MKRLESSTGEYKLVVEMHDNGYCRFKQLTGENCEIVVGNQYFVCDKDMKLIQWFSYLETSKNVCRELRKLGFKLPF